MLFGLACVACFMLVYLVSCLLGLLLELVPLRFVCVWFLLIRFGLLGGCCCRLFVLRFDLFCGLQIVCLDLLASASFFSCGFYLVYGCCVVF